MACSAKEVACNEAIDDILIRDGINGSIHGRVCLVCDELLKKKEACTMKLGSFSKYASMFKCYEALPPSLVEQYQFKSLQDLATGTGSENCLKLLESFKGCLLSPRSKLVYSSKKLKSPKVLLCKECKGV